MNPSEGVVAGESQMIGGYLLRRVLGRGGMGTVHLATTPAGGLAAVKVINPELARDPAFRRRFDREVAAARRVAGFCTAPVLDAGIDGDVPYLVTEFVKGPDLAHAVREQGPMTGSNLEALAVGIAVALNAIHGAGVIHRDLKPSNVLLSSLGPRVIDFGIAQPVDGDSLVSQAILGTPAFMAPEQIRGEPLTPAADIYAWGGVIAFAGTGRLPFGGGAPAEVLYRIVNEGPNLHGLDERMRGLIERAMAKDPARRPSAPELLGELFGGQDMTPATATQVVEKTWTDRLPEASQVGGSADTGERARSGGSPGEQAQSGPDAAVPVRSPGARGGRRGLGGQGVRRGWRTALLAGLTVTVVAAGAVTWWAAARPTGGWPFHADFSGPDHHWSVDSTEAGSAEVSGGSYRLTVNPGWRLWKSAPAPGEPENGVVISSSARLTAGSGEFGVWCRGDSGSGDRYEFVVSGVGTVSITKRRSGQKAAALYGPTKNANIKKSANNRIVAECRPDGRGVALRMWVNESFAGEATDGDPYDPGQTGVHAAPDTGVAVQVRFGSFDVRPVEG
ncbi:serine/threonine-protein kinase [Streptosporangium sp. NPDC000396]|uniref:serine/threonine-protein kinase n=1 Tax=Streptosporangium sp. NPDC000396 TaxID=3366185 RepID=UPI003691861D